MKNQLYFISCTLMSMLLWTEIMAQSDVLNHNRVGGYYIGWGSTFTNAGTLDIRNDINNSGTTYDIDFYINNVRFMQVLTTGDCNLLNAGGTGVHSNAYEIGGDPVLWHNNLTTNLYVGVGAGSANVTGTHNTLVGNNAGNAVTTSPNNTIVGYHDGQDLVGGVGANVLVGANAGENITSSGRNVFVGFSAGATQTSGSDDNTFIGWEAGMANTDGSHGTFVGDEAGIANTTGDENTIIGGHAGVANTTGSYNSFLGYEAGAANTTSSENTALGYKALHAQTTATEGNTAIGYEALNSVTTMGKNVAVGNGALHQLNTACGNCDGGHTLNTVVGFEAFYNSQAYGGCGLGFHAAFSNTTGCSIIAIGEESAFSNTIADNNIAIGYDALHNNRTLETNLAVGNFALGRMQTPCSSAVCTTKVTTNNTAIGHAALLDLNSVAPYDGLENVALGRNAGRTLVHGADNTFVGFDADVCATCTTLTNAAAVGANAVVSHDNEMILGDNAVSVGIGYSIDATHTTQPVLPGKLSVHEDAGSVGSSTIAGYFQNSDGVTSGTAFGARIIIDGTPVDEIGLEIALDNAGSITGEAIATNNATAGNNNGIDMTLGDADQSSTGFYMSVAGGTVGLDATGISADIGKGTVTNGLAKGLFFDVGNISTVNSAYGMETAVESIDGAYGFVTDVTSDGYANGHVTDVTSVSGDAEGILTSVTADGDAIGFITDVIGTNGDGYGSIIDVVGAGSTLGLYANAAGGSGDNIGVWGISGGSGTGGNNIGVIADGPMGVCSPIGATCTDLALLANGDAVCLGNPFGWSDRNFKENIQPISDPMSIINRLEPKTYTSKISAYPTINLPHGQQYGLIAQDVEQISELTSLVKNFRVPQRRDSLGKIIPGSPIVEGKALNYNALIPFLIAGMKQQQETITQLQEQITTLDQRLNNCCNSGEMMKPMFNDGGQNPYGNPSDDSEGNGQFGSSKNTIPVQLTNAQAIILDQNVPNPFKDQTTISYNIPDNVKSAQMLFYDNLGRVMQTVEIPQKGAGQLKVYADDLSSGIYSYSLIVDGNVYQSKKMVVEQK